MIFEMPKMNMVKFRPRLMSHLHVLEKICPQSEGYSMGEREGITGGTEVRLEIEPYFIVTFYPEKGEYILTAGEDTDTLTKLFSHMMSCDKCLEVKGDTTK